MSEDKIKLKDCEIGNDGNVVCNICDKTLAEIQRRKISPENLIFVVTKTEIQNNE